MMARLNYSPNTFARWLRKDTLDARKLERLIDTALLIETFDQEMVTWLREGLEKGFVDECFFHSPIVQNENNAEIVLKLASLTTK